jgi:hypothetical protein
MFVVCAEAAPANASTAAAITSCFFILTASFLRMVVFWQTPNKFHCLALAGSLFDARTIGIRTGKLFHSADIRLRYSAILEQFPTT